MDFDFLDRSFLEASRKAVVNFREAIEQAKPPEAELEKLCGRIKPYGHCTSLEKEFALCGVDGSGEFPILQQDDVFVHFISASGTCYQTESNRQHRLATTSSSPMVFKTFAVLRDERTFLVQSYEEYLEQATGLSLSELVSGSDYCEAFSRYGKQIGKAEVTWGSLALAKASQIATHAYQLRSIAELGMAVRLLEKKSKYILLDTTLVYFLLGETPYLPEIIKRFLICQANKQGSGIVALSKSHNIPNGDLIGRWAREKYQHKDHWYLRLPSEALGEKPIRFLREKEIPPKLSVSYLLKFHNTSFPLRVDVDAVWWKKNIYKDVEAERGFFRDLDFTCHDVRSYGYPYPLHAAHRSASLTKQEKKTIRDILLQNAQSEGVLRGAFLRDPEAVHWEGI